MMMFMAFKCKECGLKFEEKRRLIFTNKYINENQKLVNMVVQNLIKIDYEVDTSRAES